MNQEIRTWSVEQRGRFAASGQEKTHRCSIFQAGKAGRGEAIPHKRLVVCPYCGTEVGATRAGIRWCAQCHQIIAIDDGGQVWASPMLDEARLADLVCLETDLALLCDPERGWHPGADPVLQADFGTEDLCPAVSELIAQIAEDLSGFDR